MATKIVTVDTLTVAKRWQKRMQDERHPYAKKKIGIWEYSEHGNNTKGYTYSSSRKYIVVHSKSLEPKISNLGKRIA